MAKSSASLPSLLATLCCWFFLFCGLASATEDDSSSIISSSAIKISGKGILQYHHASTSSCDALVIINVGTAMSVGDYTKLGTAIAATNNDFVAVLMDNNPGNVQKQSAKKYANLANAIVQDLSDLVSVCQAVPSSIVVGGHSAGGQGGVQALTDSNLFEFNVAGFIGLAPYKISPSKMSIPVPALLWGFSRESCSVKPQYAAEAAYQIVENKNKRVFYQVQTHNRNTWLGGPHCSFADNGCSILKMCSGGANYTWIPGEVANTLHMFVNAVPEPAFTSAQFDTLGRDDVIVYLGPETATF